MKKEMNKKGAVRNKILIAIALIISLVSITFLVMALTDDEKATLQNELASLEQNLSDSGYSWLINQSVDYSSINESSALIEIFRQDSNDLIANIENITSANYYKTYLSGLSENESYDVFDLRVVNNPIEFDYIVDPWNGTDWIYNNVSDVFYDFEWYGNNIKIQVRSCDDSACSGESFIGPDNTTGTWFDNPVYNDMSANISNARYFQFKAYLFRNDTLGQNYTAELYNVSIGAYNSTYIDTPNIYALPDASEPDKNKLLNCSAIAYTPNTNVNITFTWYNGSILYSSQNASSVSNSYGSNLLIRAGSTGEVWNCSVYAYDGVSYSNNQSSVITFLNASDPLGYYYVSEVFHDFE